MIIALIGYRGTGKTTVARELARRLEWQWVDADEQLESRAGRSIADIFAAEGEGAFRELESIVLVDLMGRPNAVLATGGGVVLREENRRALAKADLVVWLRASVETICRRIAEDTTTAARRPNLTAEGGAAEVARLLAEREPYYRQCAQLDVDTEGHSAAEIATFILLNLPRAAEEPTLNALVAVPLGWRLLASFLVGAVAGAVANWVICALYFSNRGRSALRGAPHPRDDDDRWLDRLPLVGWLRLRRKGRHFGYEFWLRPLLVEVLTGALFAGLYWWEIGEHGLVIRPWPALPDAAFMQLSGTLHAQLAAHWLLTFLLVIATFIDLDELTIPDVLTVPGTLVGLAWMSLSPASALPQDVDWNLPALLPLHLASPRPWPASLAGWPQAAGLACGLACYLLWCFALLPRTWRTRRGYRRAFGLFLARIARDGYSKVIALMAVAGSAAIAVGWYFGGSHWQSLLSSLVGLAVGMLLVWAVRVMGSWALRREAMGFGDVTLLAMIGAFVGWQPVLLVFFFAPFAGLVFGLIQLLVRREKVMPFGPFLCLAALGVVARWPVLWERTVIWFGVRGLVPIAVGVCLVGLAISLAIWAAVKRLVFKA